MIYCSNDDGALVSPNSVESWRTLRRAAELRHYEDILGIRVNSPDEIPEVYFHRECRSIFTMKRDLEKIISDEKKESKRDAEMTADGDSQRRASMRGQPSTSRVFEKLCMFCEKRDKYKKGSKTRENLTQARQLRTDISVGNSTELRMDSRVLALLSRELTATEVHYHRSCYRQYTKVTSTSAEVSKQNENTIDEPYDNAEAAALVKLFNYIRNDIFVNKQIADTVLSHVLQEGGNSRRIDVVFDVYKEISIKSAEREWREEGESVTYKNLTAGQKIKQFRNFPRNGQNKNSLITFFNDYWRKPESKVERSLPTRSFTQHVATN